MSSTSPPSHPPQSPPTSAFSPLSDEYDANQAPQTPFSASLAKYRKKSFKSTLPSSPNRVSPSQRGVLSRMQHSLQNTYIKLKRRAYVSDLFGSSGKRGSLTAASALPSFFEHKSWTATSDAVLRRKHLFLFLSGWLGIVIMIVSNIINFQWWHSDTSNKWIYDANARGPELTPLRIIFQCLKCLNVLVTLVSIAALINYYSYYAAIKKQRWGYLTRLSAFYRTSLIQKFFLELAVLCITPIPFIEIIYTHLLGRAFLHKLDLLMFLRLYLVVRLVRDYSTVYKKRAKIVENVDYKRSLPEFGWKLTVQMLFYKSAVGVLFIASVSLTLIAAFCIWVAERDTDNKALATYYNSMWLTLISSMTLGFGDVLPTRTYGRVIVLGQGLLGIFLVSIFSGVLITKLTPTEQQQAAVHYLKREKLTKERLNEAVRILQIEWLYKRKKCSFNYHHNRVRTSMARLQRLRRQLLKLHQQSDDNTLSDLLKRQQELKNSVQRLSRTLVEIRELVRQSK